MVHVLSRHVRRIEDKLRNKATDTTIPKRYRSTVNIVYRSYSKIHAQSRQIIDTTVDAWLRVDPVWMWVHKGYCTYEDALFFVMAQRTVLCYWPSIIIDGAYALADGVAVVRHATQGSKRKREAREDKGVFRLLDLPCEMRLLIFQQFFRPDGTDPIKVTVDPYACRTIGMPRFCRVKPPQRFSGPPNGHSFSAILGAKKQLFHEALPVLYRNTIFRITMVDDTWCMSSWNSLAFRRAVQYNRQYNNGAKRTVDHDPISSFAARHIKRVRILIASSTADDRLLFCNCPYEGCHVTETGFSGLLTILGGLEEVEVKFQDDFTAQQIELLVQLPPERRLSRDEPAICQVLKNSCCRVKLILPTTQEFDKHMCALHEHLVCDKRRHFIESFMEYLNDGCASLLDIEVVDDTEGPEELMYWPTPSKWPGIIS